MLKKIINFIRQNEYILFIIILSGILRLVLSDTPPSLNWDEVSHGYNAYSIFKTGRDEWGNLMPLIFRAYGDYKLPVYIYLTALSEFIFGLSSFAVRLPSILAGIGNVLFSYLLIRELLFKNKILGIFSKHIALTTALLVAVEPWSLFISRAAFEANLGLLFFIVGAYLFFKFVNRRSGINLLLSLTFFGLTVWTYNSYRIFTPLMILFLIFLYNNELKGLFKNTKLFLGCSLLGILFFVPMFFQLLSTSGQARFSWVGILDQGSINRINESRGNGCPRILCNRYVYTLREFSKNYLSHFSPSFLFFKGGTDFQFSVPGSGLLYIIEIPLVFSGLFFLFRGLAKKDKVSVFLFAWLILAPIPSALTREAPHVLRTVTLLPLPMIISALGFFDLLKAISKKYIYISLLIYLISVFGLSEVYLNKYFGEYRRDYSGSWQFGYKETVGFIKDRYSDYDKIIMTKKYGEPHEFILFFMSWDPSKYNSDPNLNRFYQTNWYWIDAFDKFYFVNDWQIPGSGQLFVQESKNIIDCSAIKCLLISGPDNSPENWKKLKVINFLNNKPAFEFYENR